MPDLYSGYDLGSMTTESLSTIVLASTSHKIFGPGEAMLGQYAFHTQLGCSFYTNGASSGTLFLYDSHFAHKLVLTS